MVARNKVVLNGTMIGGEIWSTGITYAGPGGEVIESAEGCQDWAEAVAALFPSIIANDLGNYLSTSAEVTGVTVYHYPASGPADALGTAPTPDSPGLTAITCPFQTSVVMSMRTASAGASFRGRNYWPALAADILSTGRIATGDATDLATRWTELLVAIAEASTLTPTPVPMIYSATRNLITPVTFVSVGDVPDTQRRRRNALVESYSSAPYPPSA